MANGIKYGTSAQDGALRKGNVQFTVSPAEFGPTSSSGYYAGINPPSGGYTIYQVVSGGPTPKIFGAPNDAALVYILRQLTGTAYTYPTEAMNDVATNHPEILVMNKNFPPMTTVGAQVVLDASFTGCYPREDLKFYNIGAGQGYAALLNGPTLDNNVAFSLDGGDDDIRISGNLGAGSTATVVLWLKTTDPTFVWMSGQTSGHYVGATAGFGNWYDNAVGSPTYYINTQSSYSPKTPFDSTDDRFHMFEAKNVDLSGWNINHIFNYAGQSGDAWNIAGFISIVKVQIHS
jgi:hypothetical protein